MYSYVISRSANKHYMLSQKEKHLGKIWAYGNNKEIKIFCFDEYNTNCVDENIVV